MESYKRGSHTVWDCKYHVVWVTKYRYQVLGGDVGMRCRELVRETARAHEMLIHAGSVNRDHETDNETGRCRHGGERGSEVSPCRLLQNELIQGQIRHRFPQSIVLFLQPVQFSQLVGAHTAILLAPSVVGLPCDAHVPDRIHARHALPVLAAV